MNFSSKAGDTAATALIEVPVLRRLIVNACVADIPEVVTPGRKRPAGDCKRGRCVV